MPAPAAQPSQGNPSNPRYQILSLDGGGIYGLITATWLRQIAAQQPGFLAAPGRKPGLTPPQFDENLSVIAGASSGAVNALLLARHERPREALLSGELEGFWKRAGVFSNTHPVTSLTSFWGFGAWFGTEDLMSVLNDYFGSMRLRDLHHNVLISCYDWSGHGRDEFIGFNADAMGMPWAPRPAGMEAFQRPPPGGPSRGRAWRPRSFTNFLPLGRNNQDWDYRVADLAYAACAAPGFRAVRGGLADAASATVNPAVEAITSITYLARWHQAHSSARPQAAAVRRAPASATEEKKPPAAPVDSDFVPLASGTYTVDPLYAGLRFDHEYDHEEAALAGQEKTGFGILDEIAILSLGDGTVEPSFWLEHFDFSVMQLMMSPVNPFAGNFYTPSTWLSLDAPTQNIDDYARALIGPNRYMRVDPQLVNIPTLVASGMARFPWYRQWLTESLIPGVTSSQPSNEAIQRAIRFLEQRWWLTDEQARAAM